MKITGNVLNIELLNIKLADLKGVELLCQETMVPFIEGDKIMVMARGVFTKEGEIEVDNSFFLVKAAAAQDFLTRYIDNQNRVVDNSENSHCPNEENIVKTVE